MKRISKIKRFKVVQHSICFSAVYLFVLILNILILITTIIGLNVVDINIKNTRIIFLNTLCKCYNPRIYREINNISNLWLYRRVFFYLNFKIILFKKIVKAHGEVRILLACKDSKAFVTRQNGAIEKLGRRRINYEEGSVPYRKITSTIARTKIRFIKYNKQEFLCGITDGLPHLIVDGRPGHAGEFFVPGVIFLFITGYIGWAGRRFLQYLDDYEHFFDFVKFTAEIIINVPIVFSIVTESFSWPSQAWKELVNGELLVPNENFFI